MPLKSGKSRATIGENIAEMIRAGHEPAQAAAASYRKARESGAKLPKKKSYGKGKMPGSVHMAVRKRGIPSPHMQTIGMHHAIEFAHKLHMKQKKPIGIPTPKGVHD